MILYFFKYYLRKSIFVDYTPMLLIAYLFGNNLVGLVLFSVILIFNVLAPYLNDSEIRNFIIVHSFLRKKIIISLSFPHIVIAFLWGSAGYYLRSII